MHIVSISFPSAKIGYLAATDTGISSPYTGTNYIFKTINGGLSWTKISDFPSLIPPAGHNGSWTGRLTKVRFINELDGYVVGYEGLVYKTSDGGLSWNYCPYPAFDYTIQDIFIADQSTAWVTAADSKLYKTNDSGMSW